MRLAIRVGILEKNFIAEADCIEGLPSSDRISGRGAAAIDQRSNWHRSRIQSQLYPLVLVVDSRCAGQQ